jgi:hypothetical protein
MEPTQPMTVTITSTVSLDLADSVPLALELAQAHADVWSFTSPLAAPLWFLAVLVLVFGLVESYRLFLWRER